VEWGLYVFEDDQASTAIPMGSQKFHEFEVWSRSFARPDGPTPLGRAVLLAGQAALKSKMSRKHVLVVTDGESNRFFKYDMNGKFLYAFGYYGFFPGGLYGLHQFSVDTDGNVYVAEVFSGRAQKFTPKLGADRSKLITPPQRLPHSKSTN